MESDSQLDGSGKAEGHHNTPGIKLATFRLNLF